MSRSPMQQALLERMSPLVRHGDGTCEATFTFDRAFPGFDGHFPGNPIVPGICELSAVELMAQEATDNPRLRTAAILQVKFRAPLLPDDRAVFTLTLQEQEGRLIASATVRTAPEGPPLAKMRLALCAPEEHHTS